MGGTQTQVVRARATWRAVAVGMMLALAACGGDGEAEVPPPAPQGATAAETPTAPPPELAEAPPTPEPPVEPETTTTEDAGVDGGVEVVAPEFDVPAYAAEAPACEPHPELAPDPPISMRDMDRGVPSFPMVAALNAACEHTPADLSASFNRGGLRRHRTRDYVQSKHYFGQALVADPSQLGPRFNLACALAQLGDIDSAIAQLEELDRSGPEGRASAARAQTDRDFAAYHGTPRLAALVRGLPAAVEALPASADRALAYDDQPSVEMRDTDVVAGERVWQSGVLDAAAFQAFVLALESDRRRFHFFSERVSDAGQQALTALGLSALTRHAAWTPSEDHTYLVVAVSSRDEVRHTLYVAELVAPDAVRLVEVVELAAPTCAEGVEPVATFVVSPDHRAFGHVSGCLDQAPATLERCLFYFAEGRVMRRCGHGAPAAPAE